MAGTLTVTLLALGVALLAAPPAQAVGAAAPFTPPSRAAALAAAPTSATESGNTVSATPLLATPAPETGLGLTGIQLGAQPRALIDGEWVALGAAVRGARLHALRADEAQLRHSDGRMERLLLTPLVELHAQPLPQPQLQPHSPPTASRRDGPHTVHTVRPAPSSRHRPQPTGSSAAHIPESP